MDGAKTPELREQLVLFPSRLDDAIAPDHNVRLLDDILLRLDWSSWEAAYELKRGQPPIHPRVLASVILYGLLTWIRTSRALEEAFDGTRVRANNRGSGSRTPAQLREMKTELAAKFAELEAKTAAGKLTYFGIPIHP